jgi:hypothetical protein
MVGLDRLELSTSPLSGVRSNHLSYRPGSGRIGKTPNANGATPKVSVKKKEKRRRRRPANEVHLDDGLNDLMRSADQQGEPRSVTGRSSLERR